MAKFGGCNFLWGYCARLSASSQHLTVRTTGGENITLIIHLHTTYMIWLVLLEALGQLLSPTPHPQLLPYKVNSIGVMLPVLGMNSIISSG